MITFWGKAKHCAKHPALWSKKQGMSIGVSGT